MNYELSSVSVIMCQPASPGLWARLDPFCSSGTAELDESCTWPNHYAAEWRQSILLPPSPHLCWIGR